MQFTLPQKTDQLGMLNWSSSAARGDHSQYKAGARAPPQFSHQLRAGAERSRRSLTISSLDLVFPTISNFKAFHSDDKTNLLQVLGILQLDPPKTAHHVTQGKNSQKKEN